MWHEASLRLGEPHASCYAGQQLRHPCVGAHGPPRPAAWRPRPPWHDTEPIATTSPSRSAPRLPRPASGPPPPLPPSSPDLWTAGSRGTEAPTVCTLGCLTGPGAEPGTHLPREGTTRSHLLTRRPRSRRLSPPSPDAQVQDPQTPCGAGHTAYDTAAV